MVLLEEALNLKKAAQRSTFHVAFWWRVLCSTCFVFVKILVDNKKCIIWYYSRRGVFQIIAFFLSWKVGVMIQFEEHGFSNALKPPPSNIA